MPFVDWLLVIAPALGLKTILDTNSIHTGIAYAYLIAPHSCNNFDTFFSVLPLYRLATDLSGPVV